MKCAVVMVVDGLRADMVSAPLTPALARHGDAARRFVRHRCVFPSATRINSASIATGCYPGSHGLAGNAIALDDGTGLKPVSVGPPGFRDLLRRATGRTLHRPTLAERVREHGGAVVFSNSSAGSAHMQDPDGHGTLYHRDGSFAPGLTPITGSAHLDVSHDGAGDAATVERFCEAFQSDDTTALWVVWICERWGSASPTIRSTCSSSARPRTVTPCAPPTPACAESSTRCNAVAARATTCCWCCAPITVTKRSTRSFPSPN